MIGGFYLPEEKKSDISQDDSSQEKADITDKMILGYLEMSDINLALAEDALITDNQLWSDILD